MTKKQLSRPKGANDYGCAPGIWKKLTPYGKLHWKCAYKWFKKGLKEEEVYWGQKIVDIKLPHQIVETLARRYAAMLTWTTIHNTNPCELFVIPYKETTYSPISKHRVQFNKYVRWFRKDLRDYIKNKREPVVVAHNYACLIAWALEDQRCPLTKRGKK